MQVRLCVRTIAPVAACGVVAFASASSQPLFVPAFDVPWDSRALATSIAAADVNGDGRPDLVFTVCGIPGDC
jgi:hypothetical protein